MHILLANSTCKVGGVSTFMLSLHKALNAAGHDCSLFFFERGPMEALLPSDVPVRFGTLADCLRLVQGTGVNVVHANNVDWTTGISAVRDVGARLVLTAHKVREPAFTYGWRAANCDGFAAVSAWIGDALQPFTDAPITVVRNGIDTHRFRAPGDSGVHRDDGDPRPIAAWVGRGSAARKRLERFAAIAPFLRAAGMRVWVIDQQGPQHFAARFPEAAAALESAAERWEGVDYESMPATYAEIARSGGCVVSTASMEGLPLSLLEAQACGALVVAPDVLGVNECVFADHGGVLYPDDLSDEGLAALVEHTLADTAAVRRKQRLAASYVAGQFSLDRLVRDYTTLYTNQPATAVRTTASPKGWTHYGDQRLGVGYRQFDALRELAAAGAWQAAAAAGRAAMRTAPAMFARPSRLWQLMRTLARASSRTPAFSWTARKGITRV